MKLHQLLLTFLISSMSTVAMARTSVPFIGNSLIYGWGSPVRNYRASTVTDLNNEGIGGVPAQFKSFADQAGLDCDVYLETRGGAGYQSPNLKRSEYVQSGSAWANSKPRGFRSADCLLHSGRLKQLAHSVADDCQTVLSYFATC